MAIKTSSPETVGMSSDRLSRIQPKFQSYIDDKKAPGFITLIARKGKIIHYETCGYRDLENQLPMEKDTLFRIYSMTKPITSIALMMLYEQGKFQLYEPVSKYIPEFGKTKVFQSANEQGQQLVEQDKPMTIHNLLTHTSGLTYDIGHDNREEEASRIAHYADPNITLEETIKAIAELPLVVQPSTEWVYSVSTDVCGYLVQVLSGMPFDTFLQEKIFSPLGMVDTAFDVPEEKTKRFAALYAHDMSDGSLKLHHDDGLLARDFFVPTQSPFGGHGLVSTTEDYWRFTQMLMNNGEFKGTRLLGRKTIEFIRSNHIKSNLLPLMLGDWELQGMGFGLGFAVVMDAAQTQRINSNGSYTWGGAAATGFWIDPQEEIIGILMTQIMNNMLPTTDDLLAMTYQALVD